MSYASFEERPERKDVHDFTLGEAKRQIGAIWKRMDGLNEDLQTIKKDVTDTRESILRQESKNDEILRQITAVSSGTARCYVHDAKLEDLRRDVESVSNCGHCKNSTKVQIIESRVERAETIIKWAGTTIGGGFVLFAMKAIWDLIAK